MMVPPIIPSAISRPNHVLRKYVVVKEKGRMTAAMVLHIMHTTTPPGVLLQPPLVLEILRQLFVRLRWVELANA